MDKICPLMSREMMIDENSAVRKETMCQREKCALWVNFVKGQEEYSHCGLIRGE